jgi:hypothetical protein
MKSYRKKLWFKTPGRRAFLNITSQVEAALKESGVQEGLALVNAMPSPHPFSSTTTRGGCTPTTRPGSKGSRRTCPDHLAQRVRKTGFGARLISRMKPASIGCASVVAAPTFGRGDDRNSIGEVEFCERIRHRELGLEAVGTRTAFDVTSHVGHFDRLADERDVLLLDHERWDRKRPPAERDTARLLHGIQPHDGEVRIGTAE